MTMTAFAQKRTLPSLLNGAIQAPVLQRVQLIGVLFCALLVASCSATQITETEWTPSPDGRWLTRITRYDTAGLGANSLYEVVKLKRRGSSKTMDVLTLDEGEMTVKELGIGAVIRLAWRDPHHLEIGHRAGDVLHGTSQVADLSIGTTK